MKRALALIEQQKAKRDSLQEITSLSSSQTTKYSQRRVPSANRLISNDKIKLVKQDDNNLQSRKSTAVSSTTRVGSGKETQKHYRQTSDILNEKDSRPIVELSLQNNKKKPPHKLKPLVQKANDKLEEFLGEYETSMQRQMFQELESDMKDYLDQNQILSQMKTVFGESSSSSNVLKAKKKKGLQLEPILEESHILNQIIPYKPNQTVTEQRAKKNELLKQKVKKLTTTTSSFNESSSKDPIDTFITSCKTKEENNQQIALINQEEGEESEKSKKYYKYKEDELLDEVDQYEKDMNEMFKYLNEVEELIKGNDLKAVESMIEVTEEGMNQHFELYDKLKEQIISIDKSAEEALKQLTDNKSSNEESKQQKTYDLVRIEEGNEEFTKDNTKPSQEHQKKNIVNQLLNINQSMKDFSSDLANKLDKAYKSGTAGKYGYQSVSNLSQVSSSELSSDDESRREERKLNKLANTAKSYLDNYSIIGGSSLSNQSKKLNFKALPSSASSKKQIEK